MKLNIISWNIRHLRIDKVTGYLRQIISQVASGHVMFFYENKERNEMGRDFVDAIGEPLKRSADAGSMRLEWAGIKYSVGTNEYVWVIYSKSCTTGPNSKNFPGAQPFSISVTAVHDFDAQLRKEGLAALKHSMSDTIQSNLAMQRDDFRIPAVFSIVLNKPDGTNKTIRVASWHAPGPAVGAAPLLNYVFQTALKGQIDLFIGDFNMTGLDEQTSKVSLPMTLYRTNASTTYTASGPVPHNEGFDLVYADSLRIAPGITVTGSQIGTARVGVVPIPSGISYADAYELTDHLPVIVELKQL